jgi:hypothetical protein
MKASLILSKNGSPAVINPRTSLSIHSSVKSCPLGQISWVITCFDVKVGRLSFCTSGKTALYFLGLFEAIEALKKLELVFVGFIFAYKRNTYSLESIARPWWGGQQYIFKMSHYMLFILITEILDASLNFVLKCLTHLKLVPAMEVYILF